MRPYIGQRSKPIRDRLFDSEKFRLEELSMAKSIGYSCKQSFCYNLNMKGYIANIEKLSLGNEYFREVLYTAKNSQLVVMSLKPNEEIGEETHRLDQFIRCEIGIGKAILDGVGNLISDGFIVVVPAGTRHNIINTSSDKPMKLYTLYSPPNHIDGTIHKTKADAEADEKHDHFDGKTTDKLP